MDAPPAGNPAVGVRRELDGGVGQADGQDTLRELDGALQAHQGDVSAGALLPGVHRVGLRRGDTHLLGPWARVPQLPGSEQHRELGWFVQITKRTEGRGRGWGLASAQEGPGKGF